MEETKLAGEREAELVSEPMMMGTSGESFASRDAMAVGGAVLLGALIIAGTMLYVGGRQADLVAKQAKTPTPAAADDGEPTGPVTVSLDDDPVLGDRKKAKIAIVEWSDYECPFCKRFHQDTYDKIVKEYVDTGKAVFAFRDYPLPFHDPKATEEAMYATCAKEQKGDKTYFDFGRQLYEFTQTNGKGLPEGKLPEVARKLGLDVAKLDACVKSGKYADEIKKDMADGQAVGIQGTPSFVIGTIDGNNVTGERVVGAVPFEQIKAKLDALLQ